MRGSTLLKNSVARLVAVASCMVCAPFPGAPPHAAEEAISVWQGVYTKEQAARGKTRYFASCAVCHGAELQGDSDSPELAGKSFIKRGADQSVGTLSPVASCQIPVALPASP